MKEQETPAAGDLAAEIAQWKAKYGEDAIHDMTPQNVEEDEVWSQIGVKRVICRRPERRDMSRLAKGLSGDAMVSMQNLVYDCLLYPSRDMVDKLFAKKPGLIISLGNALQELAGVLTDFLPRKL